jgi:phage baseplate assembly protein W
MPRKESVVQDIDPKETIARSYRSILSPDPGSRARREGGL